MTESISDRFKLALSLHLISNFRPSTGNGSPLILAIQGPTGEGKTFQTELLLRATDIHTVLLSGGELESPDAGMPAARIRTAYLEAGTLVSAKRPAVLLLNDADAAIGSWGDLTQYTVNTQNMITELMHLADYPTRVEGRETPRVPIILTGNDFTRLYAPLRRSGRMRIFTWCMEPAERARAVHSIFPTLRPDQALELVTRLPDQSIAFWAAVRTQVDDAVLTRSLARHGLRAILSNLVQGGDVQVASSDYGFEQVAALAEAAASAYVHNYL